MSGSPGQDRRNSWRIVAVAGVIVALLLALGLGGVIGDDRSQGGAGQDPAPEAGVGRTNARDERAVPKDPPPPPTPSDSFGSLRGTILSPPSATVLSEPTFEATLRISGDPEGRHVWLAVMLNLTTYFPQGGEREVGEQSVEVAIGPGVRSFVLVLIAVDDADNQAIIDWIRNGRDTGARPPLNLPSVRHLDEVALLYAGG